MTTTSRAVRIVVIVIVALLLTSLYLFRQQVWTSLQHRYVQMAPLISQGQGNEHILPSKSNIQGNLSMKSEATSLVLTKVHNTTTPRFSLEPSFQVPWNKGVNGDQLQAAQWMEELKSFLGGVDVPGPVTLVSSSSSYRKVLFNWLSGAACAKLNNVLVVTCDGSLSELLRFKRIPSLFVHVQSLTRTGSSHSKSGRGAMMQLLVVRVAIMRLLNYWGYDVASYDADAIILKNPRAIHEMYPDSDLIGQYGGSLPAALHEEWGVVMCMGAVILMRSNERTEILWKAIAQVRAKDDQIMLNYALKEMNIHWTKSQSDDPQETEWTGEADSGLKVSLVHPRLACRLRLCLSEKRDRYYIWHRGLKTRHLPAMVQAQITQAKLWLLRDDFMSIISSNQHGTEWLRAIAYCN